MFEWDEEKNKNNFAKHGIWFEEAQTLWAEDYLEFLILIIVMMNNALSK